MLNSQLVYGVFDGSSILTLKDDEGGKKYTWNDCIPKEAYLKFAIVIIAIKHILALICFGGETDRRCQIFDGLKAYLIPHTSLFYHEYGAMGYLNGYPTAVGNGKSDANKVETLTDSGWIELPDHPRYTCFLYIRVITFFQRNLEGASAISLPSGSMITLGGTEDGSVWFAGNNYQWSMMGKMPLVSVFISRTIYVPKMSILIDFPFFTR